jgi:hypothetical protein
MEDLFAIQDEIAAAIAGELKVRFAPTARPRRQPNLQAYEAFLRYRQFQWAFTPESLRRSRECLERAIALDPEYALPYVGWRIIEALTSGRVWNRINAFRKRASLPCGLWNSIPTCPKRTPLWVLSPGCTSGIGKKPGGVSASRWRPNPSTGTSTRWPVCFITNPWVCLLNRDDTWSAPWKTIHSVRSATCA